MLTRRRALRKSLLAHSVVTHREALVRSPNPGHSGAFRGQVWPGVWPVGAANFSTGWELRWHPTEDQIDGIDLLPNGAAEAVSSPVYAITQSRRAVRPARFTAAVVVATALPITAKPVR